MKTIIKSKSYTNIRDAIYDYAIIIKTNFKPCLEIKTNKFVDYSKELQTVIYNKAKEEFQKIGKNKFKNNGEDIYVSNGDIKESIAKIVRNKEQKKLLTAHLELFSKMDTIITKGTLITSAPETKNRWQNKNWKYYVTPIKINNKKYVVEFDTLLRERNERHFRLQRIFNLEDILKTEYFDR